MTSSDGTHVLDHYGNPRHQGEMDWENEVHFGQAISDVCGDTVKFMARIDADVIIAIMWTGSGCCFSQAAASMLAEYALGKTVTEMQAFSPPDMFDLFKADCYLGRDGCILVSLIALHNLLEIE